MAPVVLVAFIVLIMVIVVLAITKSLLIVVQPNEAVVLSGRLRRLPDGSTVGYRIVFAGRVLRVPILETASRIDLSNMVVDVSLRHLYTDGGVPVDIDAVANVRVSSDPVLVRNAVERFLDRSREEIHTVARETLEGNLRQVVAKLKPRALVADPEAFAHAAQEETIPDFETLGLQLDTFKVQTVRRADGQAIPAAATEPESSVDDSPAPPPPTADKPPAPAGQSTRLTELNALATGPTELDALADNALSRGERQRLVERYRGKELDLEVTVERVTATFREVPAEYSGGRTLVGKLPGGLEVEVCFRTGDERPFDDLKSGDTQHLRVSVHNWDELYWRLVLLNI